MRYNLKKALAEKSFLEALAGMGIEDSSARWIEHSVAGHDISSPQVQREWWEAGVAIAPLMDEIAARCGVPFQLRWIAAYETVASTMSRLCERVSEESETDIPPEADPAAVMREAACIADANFTAPGRAPVSGYVDRLVSAGMSRCAVPLPSYGHDTPQSAIASAVSALIRASMAGTCSCDAGQHAQRASDLLSAALWYVVRVPLVWRGYESIDAVAPEHMRSVATDLAAVSQPYSGVIGWESLLTPGLTVSPGGVA